MIGALIFHRSKGHSLNQRQVMAMLSAPLEHRHDLILIDALQGDHVDLDAHASLSCRRNPFQSSGKVSPPRDVAKLVRNKRIEAHIDPAHACLRQRPRMILEPHAICREGELIQQTVCQMLSDPLRERCQATARERLPARQTHLANASCDEAINDDCDFLKRKQLGPRQESHGFSHAVSTAKITSIGYRNPKIGNATTKAVPKCSIACHFAHGP
jgi:hypothetical protein